MKFPQLLKLLRIIIRSNFSSCGNFIGEIQRFCSALDQKLPQNFDNSFVRIAKNIERNFCGAHFLFLKYFPPSPF